MADQKGGGWNGNEGKWVTRDNARKDYRKFLNSSAFKDLKDRKSAYLGGRKILRLLSQENAVGIRFHIGFDDKDNPQLFLTGVDSNQNDIFDTSNGIGAENGGLILDDASWCPPRCADGPGLED